MVDVPGAAILGLSTCEALHVDTLDCELSNKPQKINNIRDLMQQYPQQFGRIGELQKTHNLVVHPKVTTRIDPPRRTLNALKDSIKSELDKMVDQRIIHTIEEPTDWVSSLTYVTKRDGSIRVGLDPRQLNKELIRPRHQTPTLDDLNHTFFSKLDAKAGYWSIKLDEASQKRTTFQTPFGRYCFRRLAFGLSVCQDIFQQEMGRILEKCTGVCGIAEILWCTMEVEYNRKLLQFMDVARQHGLTINSAKCDIKCNKVSFFVQLYTSEGIISEKCPYQPPKPCCNSYLVLELHSCNQTQTASSDQSRMQARLLHPLNSDTPVLSGNCCRSYSECNDPIRTYMDGSSMSSLTTDPS